MRSKGLLSSLHSKVAPGSSEVNLNLNFVLSVSFGAPLVIVVSGGMVSGARGTGPLGRVVGWALLLGLVAEAVAVGIRLQVGVE